MAALSLFHIFANVNIASNKETNMGMYDRWCLVRQIVCDWEEFPRPHLAAIHAERARKERHEARRQARLQKVRQKQASVELVLVPVILCLTALTTATWLVDSDFLFSFWLLCVTLFVIVLREYRGVRKCLYRVLRSLL